MPDYRALITKMANELDQCHRLLMDDRRQRHPLADRARALLAKPEAEGPTDEELLESAAKALGYKSIPSDETCLTAEAGEILAYARAALARWGRPAAAPVPASERLPGPEDCDEQGRYWGLVMGCEAWVLAKGNPRLVCITHWLSANALPLPAPEGGEAQP